MYQVTYGPRSPAPIENRWGGDFATREEADVRAAELRAAGHEVFIAHLRRATPTRR